MKLPRTKKSASSRRGKPRSPGRFGFAPALGNAARQEVCLSFRRESYNALRPYLPSLDATEPQSKVIDRNITENLPMSNTIRNRFDIVYYFEISDGNPNGDPDAGNLPRIDPETGPGAGHRCLPEAQGPQFRGPDARREPHFEIYVKEKAVLNQRATRRAWPRSSTPKSARRRGRRADQGREEGTSLPAWMCNNFFDIRAFGAVMTTQFNCGQVRGPLQFGLARLAPSDRHAGTCRDTTVPYDRRRRTSWATIARWAASSPCLTPSIASTATSMPTSRAGRTERVSPRRIWPFSSAPRPDV